VLGGALEHRDSMGNREVLRRGDIQFTTAGSGISHSEYNADAAAPVRFLQIWVAPSAMVRARCRAVPRRPARRKWQNSAGNVPARCGTTRRPHPHPLTPTHNTHTHTHRARAQRRT
jgi:redox-sensitive bicupin YhaK (pirin superfamily)